MQKTKSEIIKLQNTNKIIFEINDLTNFILSLGLKIGKPENNPTELTLGLQKDALFGYVIYFGYGQKAIDIWNDCSYRIPPLTKKDAKELINQPTASHILLKGYKDLIKPNDEILYSAINILSNLSSEQTSIEHLSLEEIYTDDNNLYVNKATLYLVE
jgi:hypothetical protein